MVIFQLLPYEKIKGATIGGHYYCHKMMKGISERSTFKKHFIKNCEVDSLGEIVCRKVQGCNIFIRNQSIMDTISMVKLFQTPKCLPTFMILNKDDHTLHLLDTSSESESNTKGVWRVWL